MVTTPALNIEFVLTAALNVKTPEFANITLDVFKNVTEFVVAIFNITGASSAVRRLLIVVYLDDNELTVLSRVARRESTSPLSVVNAPLTASVPKTLRLPVITPPDVEREL